MLENLFNQVMRLVPSASGIFFIVGFLTSFFSKNMIVVIVSAIAVSHIVAYGNKMTEGLKNEGEGEEEEEEGFEEGIDEEEPKETDGEAEAETFTENIKKMEGLLNKTEELLKESKHEGFTPIGFSEYK